MGQAIAGEPGVTVSADGIPLHYRVYGSGDTTLFLIHGWSCDRGFWQFQTGASIGPFRVVTLDLAGHGSSTATVGQRPWAMETFAADVEAIADGLGSTRVAIVGHSMGGAVAVESALRLGDRCRLLLGVDTFTDAAFYRRRPGAEIAARCARFASDYAGAVAAMVEQITAPETECALRAWIARAMTRTDAAVGLAVLAQLLAWDVEARWPLLRCPVETINSAALARRGEQLALDRLSVHEMDRVGHFPMLEDPATFNLLAHNILTRRL